MHASGVYGVIVTDDKPQEESQEGPQEKIDQPPSGLDLEPEESKPQESEEPTLEESILGLIVLVAEQEETVRLEKKDLKDLKGELTGLEKKYVKTHGLASLDDFEDEDSAPPAKAVSEESVYLANEILAMKVSNAAYEMESLEDADALHIVEQNSKKMGTKEAAHKRLEALKESPEPDSEAPTEEEG